MVDIELFIEKISADWKPLKESLLKKILTKFTNPNHYKTIDFDQNPLKNIPNTFGIYIFIYQPNSIINKSDFEQDWKSQTEIMNYPAIINDRIPKIIKPENHFLYIGKSEKLATRINQHCFIKKESKTYAMKLLSRKKMPKNANIKYCFFDFEKIKSLDKSLIQFIITNLEKDLRSRLKPWIGKQ